MYKLKQKKIAMASAAIFVLTKDNKKNVQNGLRIRN